MLMVIFGAGASYDSSPDFPPPQPHSSVATSVPRLVPAPPDAREAWRPPLTDKLFLDANNNFGEIVLTYPKLRGILPFLRRPQNSRTVEQQLEFYLEEASTDEERQRQLFSVRYYLHDLFRMVSEEWLKRTNGVTNYATLIDQIRHLNTAREPVCLVSFNYDLLLDKAILPGVNPPPLEHHFDHPMFKLFKPHGSVDWARFVAGRKGMKYDEVTTYDAAQMQVPRLSPENIIERVPGLSDQYVRANATDAHQIYKFNSPIVPAIAIPVQTKTEDFFEWPDTHRKYFEQLLPQVTKILIIGWRGKEAHFLKLLRQKLESSGVTQITHLQAVGRDSTEASDIAKQFIADIDRRVNHLDTATRGFSHFVREEQVGFFFKD